MQSKNCVLVTFLSFCCFILEIKASSSSQELSLLPKIFYLNETQECRDDHYYCKVDVKLRPKNEDNPPEIWNLVQKQSVYRRNYVYRALCIGNESIEEKIQEELDPYNLKGDILKTYCYQKQKISNVIVSFDTFIGLLFLAYWSYIIFCTIKTYNSKNDVNKYQQMFSLINVWKELNVPKENEDYKNLLSFQGMRTLTMSSVITVHTVLTFMTTVFLKNPEYYDEISFIKSIIYGSFGLIVQIYFVISAWLLSVQLHNIMRKNGEFTIKDFLILWLNRYFRLLPAILIVLSLHSSDSIAVSITDPYLYSISRKEVAKCRSIWWKNLLFLQNINVKENEICCLGMWYIAADMHMYVISSLFFYISRRFKISMKYFFGLTTVVVASFQIFHVLNTEYDGLLRFNSRLLPPESIDINPEITISYIATYGSAATYIIGFVFGTIYSRNKNKIIFDTTMKRCFCYISFFGMPLLASYLTNFHPNRVMEALFTVSLRPLFSFGIAIGLLAMATGSGGLMKKFFESSPMVFLGNFTYSTYMFHFLNVFGRALFRIRYIELSDSYVCATSVVDLIASFAHGMVMYMILEHPCLKLQKSLLPQLNNKGRKKGETKVE